MRLDKYLADSKLGTRSEVKNLVRLGLVRVNGKVIKDGGFQVKETDEIYFREEKLEGHKIIYILLNKPAGYICSREEGKYPVVFELIEHLYADELSVAGRLDVDSRGLVLMTNDGEYLHKVISPNKEVYKTYEIVVEGDITEQKMEILRNGVDIGDYITKPALVKQLDTNKLEIKITEGKFHQVKRMANAVDLNVTDLFRTKIGELSVDNITEGSFIEITKEEAYTLIK